MHLYVSKSQLIFPNFSRSLQQFFLTVGQYNFGNKIPIHICIWNTFLPVIKSARGFKRWGWRRYKHHTWTPWGWCIWTTFAFQRSKSWEIEVRMETMASRSWGHHFWGWNVLWPQFHDIFGWGIKGPSIPSTDHLKNNNATANEFLIFSFSVKGSFKNYVDKMRGEGGHGTNNILYWNVKFGPSKGSRGWNLINFGPHSCWMPPECLVVAWFN